MDNKINYSIPEEVVTQTTEKLLEAVTLLQPFIIALTPEERRNLPKMSDKTQPFVEKCLNYTKSNPEFAPPYMDVDELNADMAVYRQLRPIYNIITKLNNGLDDTTMQAGAESYANALSYYNSVKLAAKMDIPGAKGIYDDLKKRFLKSPEKETPAEDDTE